MAHFYRCCACRKEVEFADLLRLDRSRDVDHEFCRNCAAPVIEVARAIILGGGNLQTVQAVEKWRAGA